MYSNVNSSGMDLIHGILDLVMLKFGTFRHESKGYDLVLSEHPSFLQNMQVEIRFLGETIGNFGILHPEVLKAFKIVYPVGALEIHVDKLFENFEDSSA
jgi:phenylalanyl-tRNA synthetase beta chain